MKLFKFVLLFVFVIFSAFFLVGFVMYVVYFVYTNYKEEVANLLKKYPQVAYLLRKIASFTSQEILEEDLPVARTVDLKRTKVSRLSKNELTNRQQKVIEIINTHAPIEMSDLKKEFPKINVRTLRRDLSKLENLNYITKSGKTKGSFYKLV